MSSTPSAKRGLAAILTVAVIGAALFAVKTYRPASDPIASSVQAQTPAAKIGDWIMYGGNPARNFVNLQAKNLPVDWDIDAKTNILWAADLGSLAYGGPIIADGRVFVGTNNSKPRDPKDRNAKGEPIDLGVLACFDEKTGAFQWQKTFAKLAIGMVCDWPKQGICSSPCVEGDLLYYVSNRCEVVCANVKDGSFVWTLDMIKELNVFPHNLTVCSPLIVGDHLFIITANGVDEGHINVPSPKAPSFIRVNKKSGKVTWSDNSPTISLTTTPKEGDQKDFMKRLVNRGLLIQHGQWSNPAYAVVEGQPQVVFPGGDGWLYSFDPESGKLLWRFDCNPKDAVYELSGKGTRNDFLATPVIYKNRVYVGVGQDPEHEKGVGHFWCIDMTKRGDASDELDGGKKNPNSAKVWHYGGATTPADRAKLKRNYYFGRTMSTASIHEDLCYVAELDGTVHCLDANTGQAYWSHDTGNMSWCATYWADGKVYFGNDGGRLTVFKHGKKKEILGEMDMDAAIRAAPVAANGVLYVMTVRALYAITEKK